MDQFQNATIVKRANVYYDGKVTSRTIYLADGTRKTLGIIMPGEYEFGTAAKEKMEVLAGTLNALLPGSETWVAYGEGQMFEVPASSKFKVSTDIVVDYCCCYIEE
ncbi:pyrimidine/purine nucleoside phosphorylase [Oscillospiraceae bacterium LTW-04]|nr:pyrimidine/purine nucleoside phosphorylase [Oscillospiraceae bacterium MB24-C1]